MKALPTTPLVHATTEVPSIALAAHAQFSLRALDLTHSWDAQHQHIPCLAYKDLGRQREKFEKITSTESVWSIKPFSTGHVRTVLLFYWKKTNHTHHALALTLRILLNFPETYRPNVFEAWAFQTQRG